MTLLFAQSHDHIYGIDSADDYPKESTPGPDSSLLEGRRGTAGKSNFSADLGQPGGSHSHVRENFPDAANSTVIFQGSCYPGLSNTNSDQILAFKGGIGGGSELVQLQCLANGAVKLSRENWGSGNYQVLATSVPDLVSSATRHYWEAKTKIHPTLGTFYLRLDGVVIFDFVGTAENPLNTTAINNTTLVNGIVWGRAWHWDDIIIMDTGGDPPCNDILGDRCITWYPVTFDGDVNQWTQFGGGVGIFTSVNDPTPDGTLSYIESEVIGNIQQFHLADIISLDEVPVAVLINLVLKKLGPTTRTIRVGLKLGTDIVWGAAKPVLDEFFNRQWPFERAPDGLAWTRDKFNATWLLIEDFG